MGLFKRKSNKEKMIELEEKRKLQELRLKAQKEKYDEQLKVKNKEKEIAEAKKKISDMKKEEFRQTNVGKTVNSVGKFVERKVQEAKDKPKPKKTPQTRQKKQNPFGGGLFDAPQNNMNSGNPFASNPIMMNQPSTNSKKKGKKQPRQPQMMFGSGNMRF